MVNKIAKDIAKLNKIPHPKGRKTAQLTKKTIKAAGREKHKLQIQMKMNIVGEKYLWFKENLEPVENYTPGLLIDLIEKYLGRFDEELEQIKLKHSTGQRKGRQHASREDIINMTIKNERNEFLTCGIEIPDILNKKQLNLLRNWSGELRYLQNFKTVRYTKGRLEQLKKTSQPVEFVGVKQEKMETEETNASETNVTETTALETSVTETTTPETNVTETTAPETNVTETTAPETNVTEANVPETKENTEEMTIDNNVVIKEDSNV